MSENVSLGTVSAEVKIGLSQVTAARTKLVAELGQIGSALDRMATESEKAGKRSEDALKRAGAEKELAKMRQSLKATADAQKQLWSEMGRGATVAGTAITGAMIGATAAASKFDGAMRNVNSIAKMNEKQFLATSKSVLALVDDKRITDGPVGLAKGLYDVYSSGKQGAEALEILKEASTGATAGLTDTATATRVLMAVLNSGVPGVNSSREAMDVLFKIVDRGVGNFEQLAGSLGAVLPMASKAGVSLQEIGAYLAVATKSGQSFAEGVNDLNNLLQKIIKPGKDTQKLFEQHGISFGMAALQGKGLSGTLQEIMEKTKGNQQALADLFPDMQAFRGVLTASAKEGRDFRVELGQMATATDGVGAKQAALNEQMKGATYQAAKAKQEIERLAIEAGQHLLPIARDLMREVHGLTSAFHELPEATQSAIVKFGLFGGVALTVFGRVVDLIAKIKEFQLLSAAAPPPMQGPSGGALPWLAYGGRTLGAAVVSTLPVTLPLAAAGGVAYAYGQDSIANSEREAGNLSLENRERIAFLQSEIAKKHQVINNLPPRSPYIKKHLADVAEMNKEMETLQHAGITSQIRGAQKAKAGKAGSGGGGAKPPQVLTDAEKEAIEKARKDKQDAEIIRLRNDSEGVSTQISDLMGDYTGRKFQTLVAGSDPNNPKFTGDARGESLRYQIVELIKKAHEAEVALAQARYTKESEDSPLSARATLNAALEQAERTRKDRQGKIRGADKKQLEEITKDEGQALLTRMEALKSSFEADYQAALDKHDFRGAATANYEVWQQDREISRSKFDLEIKGGGPVEKAKAQLQADLEESDRGDVRRQKEITEKSGESVMKVFEKSHEAYKKSQKAGKEWAEFFENAAEKAARAQAKLSADEERWAEGLAEHLEQVDAKLEELQRGPLRSFNESLARGLGESVAHFRSLEDFLTGWRDRVGAMLQDLAAEMITDWARLQLMGTDKETGAGGKDTALGSLLQFGAGALSRKKSSGGTDAAQSEVDGAGATMGSAPTGGKANKADEALGYLSLIPGVGQYAAGLLAVKKLFRFAEGGILAPGIPAMVGDSHQAANGEWVIPRVPSLAIPASMLDGIASRAARQMGGGGGDTHIIIHANLSGQADIETLGQQLAWQQDQRRKVA